MSRSAVFRYKGKETDVRAIGRELGVRAVLNGRITQRGDDLSISTELVDARDSSYLWGEQYNRKLADALAVQNEIAEQISDKLRLRLSNEQKTRMAKRQTGNPEAYQLYLKGRYYAAKFDTKNLNKGLDYLRQAIALDPNYALAYTGIAYYYGLVVDWVIPPAEAMPRAREAASKALELDESVADAHVDLGNVHAWFDFDWPAAEREFQRAIELSSNSAFAHEQYGWYLFAMSRTEKGLAEMRQAEELDPLSPEISSILGWNLYYSRRYDPAVAELRKCIDLDPSYWPGYYFLGQAYQQQGRLADAIASLQKARGIEDQIAAPLAELAHAYVMSGRRVEARQALDELLVRSSRGHVSKYVIATVAALGEKDQALAMLERAYAERSWYLIFLRLDPELDSLRSDMKFQDLLRRMNFPPLPWRG